MPARRTLLVIFSVIIAPALVAAPASARPSRSETLGTEIAETRARLELLVAERREAQTVYAQTAWRIGALRDRVDSLQERLADLRAALRAARGEGSEAPAADLGFGAAADPLFSVPATVDPDLVAREAGVRRTLAAAGARLEALFAEQADTTRSLRSQGLSIEREFGALDRLVSALQRALEAESRDERLAEDRALFARLEATRDALTPDPRPRGPVVRPSGPLRTCPVGRPRVFADDFGDPRWWGGYHQGIDMLAPLGTPVYATQSGVLELKSSSLGGLTATVHGPGGDYTYYAHLSRYARARGGHVRAGTLIGHVGNTGDAMGGPFHLHFEYHPGGGGAVDPYGLLLDVCR